MRLERETTIGHLEEDLKLLQGQASASREKGTARADSSESIAKTIFPGAPQKAQSVDCFRGFNHNTPVGTVVQRCGSPDEEVGSGVYIFLWHLADGSTLTLNTPYLSRIDYFGYRRFRKKWLAPL